MAPRSDGDRHEPAGSVHPRRQRLRDRPESGAPGRQAENVSDGRRLVLADLAYDVRALTALVDDGDVAVTEDGAAGHIPALSLELMGLSSRTSWPPFWYSRIRTPGKLICLVP